MSRRTDDQVLADVRAALKNAPVDELAIDVTMHDGVVVLHGELGSHSERLAAMTAASHAAAPGSVMTTLTVAPLTRGFEMSDADISIEVARAIVQSSIPPGSVWFDVNNRIVTLHGTAESAEQRARIRHLVQSARGVHLLENNISVATPAPAAH